MNEHDHEEEPQPYNAPVEASEEEQGEETLPALRHPYALGGATFATIGAVDLLAHLGPTGLLVGAIAGIVAARHGSDLYDLAREVLAPLSPPRQAAEVTPQETAYPPQQRGGRSVADRLLGRFPEPVEETPLALASDKPPKRLPAEMIDLAPNVQARKDDLAGKAIFVCGIRRHGKTTLGARLAEQLGKYYIPLFIPCLEGDYLSLADVLPRAVLAGHPAARAEYSRYPFAALDSDGAAYDLGTQILGQGYQVILDMSSYVVLEHAIAMQINIIRGMFHWSNTHPDQRVPSQVFLDEAQRYLPQTLSDSVIAEKTVLRELLKTYMDIIAIGGKRGIAPVILTQRFAQVNNKIMAQSEVFFLLRQTHDSDLERCMEYVSKTTATKEQIAAFQPGQGIYIASDGTQLVTHFSERESSGKRSRTPQAEAARRYASLPMRQPGERATGVPSPEPEPKEVPTMPIPAHVEPLPPLPMKQAQVEPSYADAVRVWNAWVEAHQSAMSRRKLQEELDCRENVARKYYDRIQAEVRNQVGG